MPKLSKTIDAEAFKKLPKPVQEFYTLDGESYELETEGFDDAAALKRGKDRETAAAKELRIQLAAAVAKNEETAAELETLRADKSKGNDALTAADAAWKAKLAKQETESKAQIAARENALQEFTAGAAAEELAKDLSKDGWKYLVPIIRRDITTEIVEGKPVVRVLGADGKPSDLTMKDLRKKIVDSKEHDGILTAHNGSGGGASGRVNGGGAHEKKLDLSKKPSPQELNAAFAAREKK